MTGLDKLILLKSADNAKWLLSGLGLWVGATVYNINLPHAHIHKSKLTEVVTINFMSVIV